MRVLPTGRAIPLTGLAVIFAAVLVAVGLLGALGPGGGRSVEAQELILVEPAGVELVQGANLVVYQGATMDVAGGLNNITGVVIAVWAFDAPDQVWLLWAPVLPDAFQGFSELENGRPYFIIVGAAVTWVFAFGGPLAEMPPLVFLTVSDQVFLPQRGSYCWPTPAGPGLCADTMPPVFDVFYSLEGGPIRLNWDAPVPDSFGAQLLAPDNASTPYSTQFEPGASEGDWFPEAPAGAYILMVTANWTGLPGGQSGEAAYFFPVRIDEGGLFTPVEVLAPTLSVVKGVAEGVTPTYFLTIEFGLPNGCHEFSSIEFDASGEVPVVTVLNSAPPDGAPIACIAIFRTETRTVEMGSLNPSTVIVNGETFEV